MTKSRRLKRILGCLMLAISAATAMALLDPGVAWAGGKSGMSFRLKHTLPDKKFHDATRARTKKEVRAKYNWLVNPADGISRAEALLIAQHDLITRRPDEYRLYALAKPQVVEETPSIWTVRIRAEYVFSGRQPGDWVVCIDRQNGQIGCP